MSRVSIGRRLILVCVSMLIISGLLLAACASPATPTAQPTKPPAPAATKAPEATAAPAPAATKAPEAAKPAEPAKPAAAKPAEPAKAPVNVRVGYNKTWTNIGFNVGIHRKMYDNVPGIKVSFVEFNDTVKEVEAMVGGDIDVGAVAATNLLTASEKGLKIKGVALASGLTDPPITYFVRSDSGINKIADLKGKKIGVTQYGGSFDLYLRYVLDKNGLNPEKDVEIVTIGSTAGLNAALSKQIDVTSQGGFGVLQIQEQYADRLKPVFTILDVDQELAQRFNSLVVTMSDDFVKKNRDAAKAFLKAYVDVIRFTNANPNEGKEAWATVSGNKAVMQMKSLPKVGNDAKVDLPALEFDIKVAKKFGYLKKDILPTDAIDHSLLEEVLAGR